MNVQNGGLHMQRQALLVKIYSPLQIVLVYRIVTSKQYFQEMELSEEMFTAKI